MTNALMASLQPTSKEGFPDLGPGDTVRVHQRIVEGRNERIQVFQGVIISLRGGTTPGATYTVTVTGMSGSGTVVATIPAGAANDAVGNSSGASTSTDNTVFFDSVAPTVTINQAAGQADPTNTGPINFTVVFSEAVSGFATGDVTLSGTAGATTGTVTGGGTTYNVAVSGMTQSGTVLASIAAGRAIDAAGNANSASTSTDNSVTYDNTPPTVESIVRVASSPTNADSVAWTVTFSEDVTGVDAADFVLAQTGLDAGGVERKAGELLGVRMTHSAPPRVGGSRPGAPVAGGS